MSLEALRSHLEDGPMTGFQVFAVGLCWFINILDGYDVLAIAFTAAEISDAWSLAPTELGVVFSAGLAGMMAGAIVLAPLGDRLGRRWAILMGLMVISAGMLATALTHTVPQIVATRFVTGLGIGTILASLTTISAEYTPRRWRSFAISTMQAGYPVGAIAGGVLSVWLIGAFDWRAVFFVGGVLSAILVPVVYWLMPESLDFLLSRRPAGYQARLKQLGRRLGFEDIGDIDIAPGGTPGGTLANIGGLFGARYLVPTLALWLSFFLCMMALYFLLNWTPKLVADSGFSADQGRYAGVMLNLGGAVTMVIMGWLAARLPLIRVIRIYLVAVAIIIFGFATVPLPYILVLAGAFLIGMEMAGLVGLYSVAAELYPAAMRNTGVGWAIGVGRFGAIAGPLAAGWMIEAGTGRPMLFLALGSMPVILAALFLGRAAAGPRPHYRPATSLPPRQDVSAP